MSRSKNCLRQIPHGFHRQIKHDQGIGHKVHGSSWTKCHSKFSTWLPAWPKSIIFSCLPVVSQHIRSHQRDKKTRQQNQDGSGLKSKLWRLNIDQSNQLGIKVYHLHVLPHLRSWYGQHCHAYYIEDRLLQAGIRDMARLTPQSAHVVPFGGIHPWAMQDQSIDLSKGR